MQIILKQDFTKAQEELSKELLNQLVDTCHELEEYSTCSVYGLKIDDEETSILIEINYSDSEDNGTKTIFNNY